MTKKYVNVNLEYVSYYDILDGKTITEVIDEMKDIKKRYAHMKNVHFSVEERVFRVDEGYGYDGGLRVRGRRLETDKEYESRLDDEKAEKARKARIKSQKEIKERAELTGEAFGRVRAVLARLQKKYGVES